MSQRVYALEIQSIFDGNTLRDLKRSIKKRENLNIANGYLIYLFHFIQTSGVFMSSYGTSEKKSNYIWLGITLNMTATLINVYERTNAGIMKKLLIDIEMIKNGKYLDEIVTVDIENDNNR
jgi:hypothetical protein